MNLIVVGDYQIQSSQVFVIVFDYVITSLAHREASTKLKVLQVGHVDDFLNNIQRFDSFVVCDESFPLIDSL